jgi:alpha-L-arabinofuranosidase
MTFQLPFANVASSGTVQLLTGDANASNTPDAPKSVVPSNQTVVTGTTFRWTAPGYSVAVLTVVASG